ncbi:MAG: hypothetical protein Q9218_004148 [Villophora microphyllina]
MSTWAFMGEVESSGDDVGYYNTRTGALEMGSDSIDSRNRDKFNKPSKAKKSSLPPSAFYSIPTLSLDKRIQQLGLARGIGAITSASPSYPPVTFIFHGNFDDISTMRAVGFDVLNILKVDNIIDTVRLFKQYSPRETKSNLSHIVQTFDLAATEMLQVLFELKENAKAEPKLHYRGAHRKQFSQRNDTRTQFTINGFRNDRGIMRWLKYFPYIEEENWKMVDAIIGAYGQWFHRCDVSDNKSK